MRKFISFILYLGSIVYCISFLLSGVRLYDEHRSKIQATSDHYLQQNESECSIEVYFNKKYKIYSLNKEGLSNLIGKLQYEEKHGPIRETPYAVDDNHLCLGVETNFRGHYQNFTFYNGFHENFPIVIEALQDYVDLSLLDDYFDLGIAKESFEQKVSIFIFLFLNASFVFIKNGLHANLLFLIAQTITIVYVLLPQPSHSLNLEFAIQLLNIICLNYTVVFSTFVAMKGMFVMKRPHLRLTDEQYHLLKKQHNEVKFVIPTFSDYLAYRLCNPMILKVNIGSSKGFNDDCLDEFRVSNLVHQTNQIKNDIRLFLSEMIEKEQLEKNDIQYITDHLVKKIDHLEIKLMNEIDIAQDKIMKIKELQFKSKL